MSSRYHQLHSILQVQRLKDSLGGIVLKIFIKLNFLRNGLAAKFSPRVLESKKFSGSGTDDRLQVIENVVIDTVSGYIFDSNSFLIEESTSWEIGEASARWPLRPFFSKNVNSVDPIVFLSSEAYYHWLLEDVPAYLYAKNVLSEASTGIRQHSPRYVMDLLQLLEVSPIQLPLFARIPKSIVVEKSRALSPNAEDIELLQTLKEYCHNDAPVYDRIYISRKYNGRIPLNETQVEEQFRKFGFEVLHLQNLSLRDQISIFSNCKVVAGTHGAGLSNLVWATQAKVIEISQVNQPDCFERIANLNGLTYFNIKSDLNPWVSDIDEIRKCLISL